ncbi:MAG: VanZ family protein [Thiotrichales bacterium]
MLHRSCIELEFAFLWQALGVLLLGGIALGSLLPGSVMPAGFSLPHFDKLQHLLAYALLTAWYLVVFPGRYNVILVPLFALGLGVALEWLQGMTGYRESSGADVIADAGGILFATVFLVRPLQLMLVQVERALGAKASAGSPRRRRRLRHRALWQIVGMHLAVALLITAFMPIQISSIGIPHIDKIVHFATYGGLTAWFLVVTRNHQIRVLILIGLLLLSISTEWLQGVTSFGGEPSVLDAAADAAGILLASFLAMAPLRRALLAVERYLLPGSAGSSRRRTRSASNY